MHNELTIITKNGEKNILLDVLEFKKHEYGIVFTYQGERMSMPKEDILHLNLNHGRSDYSEEELNEITIQHKGQSLTKESLWVRIKKRRLNR